MTLHIAGLGPGRPELLTADVQSLLASGVPVLLRTRHHPALATLPADAHISDCDDLYAKAGNFTAVYEAIVARVMDRARQGDLIYAVPGHPLVAESTVPKLLALAEAEGIVVSVHPGLSFIDVAATALRQELDSVQVCDALALRIDTWRPALISQVFSRDTATALKLELLELYPPEHPVTVLTSLGADDERLAVVPLSELDHRPFGYLDSVFLPPLAPIEDVKRFDGLHAVVQRLHAPGGCPWDREQTHESLRPHLLEEAYEALEAIDSGDPAKLSEELGDVLLQVLMHACVAERSGTFSYAGINEHIMRKLIRRHPHVFGDARAETADDVRKNWEALKKQEKPRQSILDGIPVSLPALAASQSIQGRARRLGFDWPDIEGPLEKLREEVGEFARATGGPDREDEFGDILFVLANIAQRLDIDAEQALRGANAKFKRRFGHVERMAADRSLDLQKMDLATLDALWDEAKALERA